MNVLVVPDSHCKPGVSNERFTWLGRLVEEWRPEVIVEIGDLFDMPSLSDYDTGKHCFEGRRYKEDLLAGQDAYRLLEKEISKASWRGRKYNPIRWKLLGNHEERILRVLNRDPRLIGTIGVEDLGVEQWGWQTPSYLSPVEINGVFFNHYMVSGVMGRPIGGENPATALCNKMHRSCVVGHLHLFDYSERSDVQGNKIQSTVVGCFLDKNQVEAYSGEAQKMWHNGVVKLHNVENGSYDLETMSISRLEKTYG